MMHSCQVNYKNFSFRASYLRIQLQHYLITIQYSLHILPVASTWPENNEISREVTSISISSSFFGLGAPWTVTLKKVGA